MVIDKQQLERLDRIAGAGVVVGEHLCAGCKYNLHGLPRDGRCPECGLPIHVAPAFDAPLSEMPRGVIIVFARAAWVASACVAALFLLVLSTHILNLGLPTRAAFLGLALAWCGAVWMLTPSIEIAPAISRGFAPGGKLRLAARVLQLGWVLAGVAYLLLRAIPPAKLSSAAADALGLMHTSGIMIGLSGIFALGVLLGRLAEWTRDGTAESSFNVAVWSISITTLLMLALPGSGIVTLVLFGLWSIAVFAFPYALLSLSRSLTWSIRHAGEYQDRLRRQRRRADDYQEEVSGTIHRMDAARESQGASDR